MSIQSTTGRPDLAELRVSEAMHPGVLTCPPETPLRDVAHMLATYNVHCVVVFNSTDEEDGETLPWAVVSDLDLAAAASSHDVEELTAGGAAASPVVLVSGGETVERAAQLMAEHETSHLVVVDPDTMHPVGVLSTIDVAAALAGVGVRSGPPRVTRP